MVGGGGGVTLGGGLEHYLRKSCSVKLGTYYINYYCDCSKHLEIMKGSLHSNHMHTGLLELMTRCLND